MNYISNSIEHYRNELMGIAIISIIVYHCVGHINFPAFPLNYGFIGVDIFMFLSGYGLCFAIKKWKIKDFYLRRLLRVYPLFLLLATMKFVFNTQAFEGGG